MSARKKAGPKQKPGSLSVLTTALDKGMTPSDFFGETYFEIVTEDGAGTVGYALEEKEAKLFAASPEMREALRDVIRAADIGCPPAYQEIRRLIAKTAPKAE